MGKARYYGIGTKRAIDDRNSASPNFKTEDTLTRPMVNGAIVALSIQNPNFDKLTPQAAAQQIKSYLKNEKGFDGELTTPGGKISDGENTYSLTHANNDKGQIVVGKETHNTLDERKKKG